MHCKHIAREGSEHRAWSQGVATLQGPLLLLSDCTTNGEGFTLLRGPGTCTASPPSRPRGPLAARPRGCQLFCKRCMIKDGHMFRRMEQRCLELTRSYLPSRSHPLLARQTILARPPARLHISSLTPQPAAAYRFAEISRFQTGVRAMAGLAQPSVTLGRPCWHARV